MPSQPLCIVTDYLDGIRDPPFILFRLVKEMIFAPVLNAQERDVLVRCDCDELCFWLGLWRRDYSIICGLGVVFMGGIV